MPDDTKTNGQDRPGPGHNAGEVRRIVRAGAEELRPLERRLEEIQASARTVKASIAKIRAEKIKAQGLALRDFDYWRDYFTRQEDDDEEKRTRAATSMKMAFECLAPEGQGDFLAGWEPEPQPDLEAIRKTGMHAGKDGKDRETNPYPEGTESSQVWDTGWLDGQRKLATKMENEASVGASAEA